MGLFSIFKKETRSIPQQEPDNSVISSQVLEFAGLSELGGLNISTFFQGVDLIAGSISQLPIYTKKKDGKGATNILKNHPTNLLWTDSKNLVSKTIMLRSIILGVIVKGNAYILIKRAEDGTPIELKYVEPSDVTIDYTKETGKLQYRIRFAKGGVVGPEDILHFKLRTWDGVKGISAINFANHTINLTNAANNHAKKYFEKGCSNVSGVLKVQGQLNKKQREQILGEWANTYSNGAAGLSVIQGNMEYMPLTTNPDEAQLLETRQFNQADICHFLNLNPAQLGLQGYTQYSSFEDMQNELLQRTLMPYIVMIENEMSRKLLKENEQKTTKIVLDTAAFLRPNKQSEASYYSNLIDKGVLNRNEVREILGFNKVEGLDEFVIPYTDIAQNTLNKDNTNEDDGEGN